MLCDQHEQALGVFDDYGVRFARSLKTYGVTENTMAVSVKNDRPERLAGFALAVIWRWHWKHRLNIGESPLGPYESPLREHLLGSSPFPVSLIVTKPNVTIEGIPAPMAADPVRIRFAGRNSYILRFGVMDMIVRMDRNKWPAEIEAHDTSERSPAHVLIERTKDIRGIPAFRPLIERFGGTA
ncbi:hypothetical protein ASC89_11445 [Devosia sp. Root413D1]|nr:hypothetical protein ASC89_11445 [Devosia sp. Root413D1]